MDRDAARRHLTEYCELVVQASKQPLLSKDRRATMKDVNQYLVGVNYVLGAIAPDIRQVAASTVNDHLQALPRVQRALALLAGAEHMMSHEWTGGGPALPLKVLDPVVWTPAAALWAPGTYRQAVADAASSVNRFTQERLSRFDISDSELMAQAFSEKEPKRGEPRLRCPGDPKNMTVGSMQNGIKLMAMGVFQAIRNPAVHMTGDWNPVTAAQHLASLSTVAGCVRNWEVRVYVAPPPDFKSLGIVLEQKSKATSSGS